jgi:hypothetical protein
MHHKRQCFRSYDTMGFNHPLPPLPSHAARTRLPGYPSPHPCGPRIRTLCAITKLPRHDSQHPSSLPLAPLQAMAAFLATQLGPGTPVPVVLYDRPHAFFRPLTAPHERHVLLSRLQPTILSATIGPELLARHGFPGGAACGARRWLFTESDGGAMRAGRPALVVSSTSWTPDEDFGILLEAARLYDKHATQQAAVCGEERLPDVMFVITGRGPQREEYLMRIQRMELHHVAFASVWLEQVGMRGVHCRTSIQVFHRGPWRCASCGPLQVWILV